MVAFIAKQFAKVCSRLMQVVDKLTGSHIVKVA